MESYLINVSISFAPYIIGAVLLLVFVFAINKSYEAWIEFKYGDSPERAAAKKVSSAAMGLVTKIVFPSILGLGLIISLVAPSNTYKHGSGHSRVQRDTQIQQINRSPSQATVQDISRQPALDSEGRRQRTEELHDFRNRVESTKPVDKQ